MQQQKSNRASSFVGKLQNILREEGLAEIISWDEHGTSFTVHNLSAFESSILPRYFRHARFSSFVRQLNMYGFSKVRTTPNDVWRFRNPRFLRDAPTLKPVERRTLKRDSINRCSVSTASSLLSLEMAVEEEVTAPSLDSFWSSSSFDLEDVEPTGDLINRLVEEVRKSDYLLESDVQERVEQLLQRPTFQPISKRCLPFIMECLGMIENGGSPSRWDSHRSFQPELDMPALIESSHI